MVPIGRRKLLPVERAGLDEVVIVLVRHVGLAHDLAGIHEPARIVVALRVGLRSAIAVRRVDRLVPIVAGANWAVLVVVLHLRVRPVYLPPATVPPLAEGGRARRGETPRPAPPA